jgi:hypothetical protein
VEVLEIVRGEPAWRLLHDANQFNEPAPEGQEHLLVHLSVTATHDGGGARSIQASDFKVTGDRLRRHFEAAAVTPEPALEAELRRGERADGWGAYLVDQGEADLLLMVEPLEGEMADAPRFIALEPGAAITVDPALADIPATDLGADSRQPASLRRTVVTEDWQVAVLTIVRGEAAWAMAQEANQFNDPPAAGLEYAAVQVHVRLIRPGDEPVWIDGGYFTVLGGDGTRYDNPAVVDPAPALDATLFPGGAATGWVVVAAPAGDEAALLMFKPWLAFDDANTRYFVLVP